MSATTTPLPTQSSSTHSARCSTCVRSYRGGADVSRSRGTVVTVVATQANRILATAHARRSGRRPLSPFRDITLDALWSAARPQPRAEQRRQRLMDEYACLSTYPDTVPARVPRARLRARRSGSCRTARRRCSTSRSRAPACPGCSIALSADTVRAYKPAPAAYALGTDAFGPNRRAASCSCRRTRGRRRRPVSRLATTFWFQPHGAPA